MKTAASYQRGCNMNDHLKSPYISVMTAHGPSYGGSQMWSSNQVMKKCGCGIVAAQDIILYLRKSNTRTVNEYCEELDYLRHHYFPLIYPSGINGFMLARGLNKLFRRSALPYHASWAMEGEKLLTRIREMIRKDCPVILSIGPNFPLLWHKNALVFYRRIPNGRLEKSTQALGHYVVVTGISDEWLQVSSWGRCYFLNIQEYRNYVKQNSNYLFSNIVYIQKDEGDMQDI